MCAALCPWALFPCSVVFKVIFLFTSHTKKCCEAKGRKDDGEAKKDEKKEEVKKEEPKKEAGLRSRW